MTLQEKIISLQKNIHPATLVLVTKKRSLQKIIEALGAGIKNIAENRLQEIEEKFDKLFLEKIRKEKVKLHFIGNIQKNKLRKILNYCEVIQSVDSLELAEKIQSLSKDLNKNIEIFIQLNLTGENQKSGIGDDEKLSEIMSQISQLPNLKVRGFMCMGIFGHEKKTQQAFRRCKELTDHYGFSEISMGMSGDYHIALEEGSTMLRIGSAVFENSSQEL